MKRLAFNKLCVLSIFVLVGCKGQVQGNGSNTNEDMIADSTASESSPQNSERLKAIDHSTDSTAVEKKAKEISKSANESPASQHKAPEQEKIDSLKRAKTNSKRKGPG